MIMVSRDNKLARIWRVTVTMRYILSGELAKIHLFPGWREGAERAASLSCARSPASFGLPGRPAGGVATRHPARQPSVT